jgi:uncharacterized membrane protein YkvA (DUF1232 family)
MSGSNPSGLAAIRFLRRYAMFDLLRLIVMMGGLVMITFLVLLALPQCRLREIVMPFVKIAFVALCGAYVLSPVDAMPEIVLGPFGMVDDLGAAVGGFLTLKSAISDFKHMGHTA